MSSAKLRNACGTSVVALILNVVAAHASVEISSAPTSNMNCTAGVCSPTAKKAVLNVNDLTGMLASGDVTVKTAAGAKDVEVQVPLSWASASRLTLDAQRSVIVKNGITVTGTGALTVTTNDGHSQTGEFVIVPKRGSVQFWDLSSSLIIKGQTYTLVGDVKTLGADIAANPSGFYALAKSYDASVDGTYASPPVGTPFQGTFEGLGNRISSLSINSTMNDVTIGFFAGINAPGTVRDFIIADEAVSASAANSIGLLTGSGNFGKVERCQASGQVSFPDTPSVAGLVNENEGTIAESSADVRVTTSGEVAVVGGLVAFNDGSIVSSASFGRLIVKIKGSSDIGGLVGQNFGTIVNSFARNQIVDGQDAAGYIGGLVGKNFTGAQIEETYAAGKIKNKSRVPLGGVIGFDSAASGSTANSYWDLDMGVSDPHSGAGNVQDDPGITGLTDAQLKSRLPTGFDPTIWARSASINNGYPYLIANPPLQ